MESKSGSIHSKSIPPMDSPKKHIVGGVSEEIGGDLKEDRVDEDGGGQVSRVSKMASLSTNSLILARNSPSHLSSVAAATAAAAAVWAATAAAIAIDAASVAADAAAMAAI